MPGDNKTAEARELRGTTMFHIVLDAVQTAVCIVDRERKILLWNDGAEKITGYLRQEVVGRLCHKESLVQCDQRGCDLCATSCPLLETMHEGRLTETYVFLRHKQGHRVLVRLRAVPIRDERGHVIGAAENFEELTLERHDSYLATYGCLDEVTGVPNQRFVRSQLRGNLGMFEDCGVPFTVLRIALRDLQHFEATRGREAGELMLRVVAQTVEKILASRAVLGRWSETEFLAIMQPGEPYDIRRESDAIQSIAQKSEIHWWNDWLSTNVSVGGATAQPGDTIESLIDRANPEGECLPPGAHSAVLPQQNDAEMRES